MHPNKAPGPDKISNLILHKTHNTIVPILHNCLLTILTLNYYPKAWQTWLTIVLWKPSHMDYTVIKAYWLIALYNTLGKIISAIMTSILVYVTMCHNLLLPKCFGSLPG